MNHKPIDAETLCALGRIGFDIAFHADGFDVISRNGAIVAYCVDSGEVATFVKGFEAAMVTFAIPRVTLSQTR